MTDEPPPSFDADTPDAVLAEMLALASARAATLGERLRRATSAGDGLDLIILLQLNRTIVELRNLQALGRVPIESLYQAASRLASELETMSTPGRSVEGVPRYDPSAPLASLHALRHLLRSRLSAVGDQVRVHEVPLEPRPYGIRTATIPGPPAMDGSDRLILMATATMPADELRSQLPARIKISHPQHLRDLVNMHQPGLSLRPMRAPPRELPYLAHASHFEIDMAVGPLTQPVRLDGKLAMHIGGDFPDLELVLWLVRKPVHD